MLSEDNCINKIQNAFNMIYDQDYIDDFAFYTDNINDNEYKWRYYIPRENIEAQLICNRHSGEIRYIDESGNEKYIEVN